MGNYKFCLSDMMPNSWLCKLKDMSRATTTTTTTTTTTKHPSKRLLNNPKPTPTTKNQQSNSNSNSNSNPLRQQTQLYFPNRPSYYISSNRPQTEHPSTSPAHPKASDPPRKSMKNHRRSSNNSNNKKPVRASHNNSSPPSASTHNDVIVGMKSLPRIRTKPAKKKEAQEPDGKQQAMLRRAQQGLHRIRVRPSSPKIEIKRSRRAGSSRGLAESFVIVKKSADPRRDFKESMAEMIAENDIRGSKGLEDLLACYLYLNSDEYHDLIVKVFGEIWIDLTEVNPN